MGMKRLLVKLGWTGSAAS